MDDKKSLACLAGVVCEAIRTHRLARCRTTPRCGTPGFLEHTPYRLAHPEAEAEGAGSMQPGLRLARCWVNWGGDQERCTCWEKISARQTPSRPSCWKQLGGSLTS